MTEALLDNPFQITSPEDLTAQQTVLLFVDVFTDFYKITDAGHVFLKGPRGTGKSMMFRYLQPDCQCLDKSKTFEELPFLGIYVPLKNTNFALTELRRFEHRHASDILNEHIMVMHFCVNIFHTLAQSKLYQNMESIDSQVRAFYKNTFLYNILKELPYDENFHLDQNSSTSGTFEKMKCISVDLYHRALSYAKKLAFRKDLIPYDGPLYDYINFLVPVLSELSRIAGFPKGPIYLLVDDAHCLNETQARVLNSWVATRTSQKVSLKISTQYDYKTYYTTTGTTIDTPHDYSEIDINTIYTGSKSRYREQVAAIVKKRLNLFGLKDTTAEQFFPVDVEQEAAIEKIAEQYRAKHDAGKGKGFYRSDDALRYARPDFIKNLAGRRKSSSTYSYAGFNQLVHLSSGIVRHFIHPAHLMFAETKSKYDKESVQFIPASIQDKIVREQANEFLFSEMEKIGIKGHENAPPREDIKKLSNLIQCLGGTFKQILLSDRSERKVISIAFSDSPSERVLRILDLGIRLGYFQISTIGRKDSKSSGRTRLYILSRRLAPIWNLDPTGFAGYLFVTNSRIEEAMSYPTRLLRRLASNGISEESQLIQLELFSH